MVNEKKNSAFDVYVCVCALFRHCFCTMMKETHCTSHATTNTRTRRRQQTKHYKKMIMNDVSALIQFRKLNIAYIKKNTHKKYCGNVLSNQHQHWIEDDGGLHRNMYLTKRASLEIAHCCGKNIKHFNNCPLNILVTLKRIIFHLLLRSCSERQK